MNCIATPLFTHPTWCDARYCTPGYNPVHYRRLHQWRAADVAVTVSLTAADEWSPREQRVLRHEPTAELHLEDLESVRKVAGHQVDIVADVALDAGECRRLADQLTQVADQLDAAGVA
jgi:hypothetical protein